MHSNLLRCICCLYLYSYFHVGMHHEQIRFYRKQSQGVKSLFLKAIKEAGETTRTASQIAGYGGGVAAKKDQGGKHKQDERTVDDEEVGFCSSLNNRVS